MSIVGRFEWGSKGKYSVCHQLISLNREWSIWGWCIGVCVFYVLFLHIVALLFDCSIRVPISRYVMHAPIQCTSIAHSRGMNENKKNIRKMRAKGILRADLKYCCCFFSSLSFGMWMVLLWSRLMFVTLRSFINCSSSGNREGGGVSKCLSFYKVRC